MKERRYFKCLRRFQLALKSSTVIIKAGVKQKKIKANTGEPVWPQCKLLIRGSSIKTTKIVQHRAAGRITGVWPVQLTKAPKELRFLSERDDSAEISRRPVSPQLSSSGWGGSNSRTWVKGKWPRFPLHSPSHWPFTLILVTITMSPTCQRQKN